ncbi:protein O-GlcNAc transferase [Azospirillaceae bacterium]
MSRNKCAEKRGLPCFASVSIYARRRFLLLDVPMPNVSDIFTRAVSLHQLGQLSEAEQLYARLIEQVPGHVGALHLMGLLRAQSGRYAESVPLFQRLVALDPEDSEYALLLGGALKNLSRLSEAAAALERAVALQPDSVEALCLYGDVLASLSRPQDAERFYMDALVYDPECVRAYNNLAVVLETQGRSVEAAAAYGKAVALEPHSPRRLSRLGAALIAAGRLEDAEDSLRSALVADPKAADIHTNLGVTLGHLDRIEEAIEHLTRAVALRPEIVQAHISLAALLYRQGRYSEALEACRRARQIDPDSADAEWNESVILLVLGDYARGWSAYESRWRKRDTPLRAFSQPQWQGEPLNGKTILLHAEQGLGDTLQFIRFAPLVAEQGGRVIVECQSELVRLLRSVPGVSLVVAHGRSLPPFDLHSPLLSLPRVFKTTLKTIPDKTPYLTAPTSSSSNQLAKDGRRRVGLVWAGKGNRQHFEDRLIDRRRSLSFAQLAPLVDVPNVCFVSLQCDEPASERDALLPLGMTLIDSMQDVKDFADTASIVAQLDLVIGVDTAVIHLAGALGKPVWVLSRFDGCWRWLAGRTDSPWYPTMRLFRQPVFGDWVSVIDDVARSLRNWALSSESK